MKKIILAIVAAGIILVGGFFLLNNYIYTEKQGEGGFQKDYKNTSYMVEDTNIPLKDGAYEMELEDAGGSAMRIVTQYFGNEAYGDVDGDGISDVAFLITQNQGGSGTFYYAVVAVKTDEGYRGTNAMFLGDRIAPQSTEIKEGIVIVNYVDRKPEEPMTAQPTVGVSKYFKIENGVLTDRSVIPSWGIYQVLTVGKSIKFDDGLTVTLVKVNDSRCKPNMVCVWAGELSYTLSLSGGAIGDAAKEVILGTTTKRSIVQNGYTLNLIQGTEDSLTMNVIK